MLPIVPAPAFFTTDQLSKRPQPLGEVDLETLETRAIPASGRLILRLWISDGGSVDTVDVEATDLPAAFSLAAVAAFRRLPFSPGERNGLRVGSIMRVEVSYIDGRPVAP